MRGKGRSKPRLSVSLGLWQDRPAAEVVRTAQAADALGYGEIWIGEMATFDAFALGAVVAERTRRASLTIGPLAVAVRDPVMIAMGAGSLTELTGRTVNVALGSSSPVVVERWHGRRQESTALALAESAAAVRALLAGDKADAGGNRGVPEGGGHRHVQAARAARNPRRAAAEPARQDPQARIAGRIADLSPPAASNERRAAARPGWGCGRRSRSA